MHTRVRVRERVRVPMLVRVRVGVRVRVRVRVCVCVHVCTHLPAFAHAYLQVGVNGSRLMWDALAGGAIEEGWEDAPRAAAARVLASPRRDDGDSMLTRVASNCYVEYKRESHTATIYRALANDARLQRWAFRPPPRPRAHAARTTTGDAVLQCDARCRRTVHRWSRQLWWDRTPLARARQIQSTCLVG